MAAAVITAGVGLACLAAETVQELTNEYVVEIAESVRDTNREDRYVLVVLSALDQPLITHYKPVTIETAKAWFMLGGQVWTPYSADAQKLINECGYLAGNSKGVVGVAERNIISNGIFGYYHYHALNSTDFSKIRLPGDGLNASAIQAHAMHCFFYY